MDLLQQANTPGAERVDHEQMIGALVRVAHDQEKRIQQLEIKVRMIAG